MSDAFDHIKNIKNGDFGTESHPMQTNNKKIIVSGAKSENGIIKNFILKWGRFIIDFFAWLDVAIAFIVFVIFLAIFLESFDKNPEQTFGFFTCMIFVPLLILLLTIAANYFIYLLIDIRDSLKEMCKK